MPGLRVAALFPQKNGFDVLIVNLMSGGSLSLDHRAENEAALAVGGKHVGPIRFVGTHRLLVKHGKVWAGNALTQIAVVALANDQSAHDALDCLPRSRCRKESITAKALERLPDVFLRQSNDSLTMWTGHFHVRSPFRPFASRCSKSGNSLMAD